METQFKLREKVQSLVTAQGLKEGAWYIVNSIVSNRTAFGGYTTYTVTDGCNFIPVVNGHLILRKVQ